jgi:hypothetical protein
MFRMGNQTYATQAGSGSPRIVSTEIRDCGTGEPPNVRPA